METIKVTEEQRDNLCLELTSITREWQKDARVKCIYYAPYKREDETYLLVTLLLNDEDVSDIKAKIDEVNLHYQEQVLRYGLKIILESDERSKYTIVAINQEAIKRENVLFNSIILYDEDGECTFIKDGVTKDVIKNGGQVPGVFYHYENLATIVPSLEEVSDLERDTEAVRKSTRTRLFEQFKKI